METASLSTLSPNTNMFRVGSRLRAWNIASVATGSTADMRDPNVKLTDKREREKNYLWPYSVVNYIVLQYVECNCFTTSDICPVDTLHPSVEEKTQQGLVNWTVCTTDHSQCIESSSDNSSTDGSTQYSKHQLVLYSCIEYGTNSTKCYLYSFHLASLVCLRTILQQLPSSWPR